MPSYSFAKEILPNLWIGITPALTDTNFRTKHHIIRDIVIQSSYATKIKPKQITPQPKKVHSIVMNGNENAITRKQI